KKYVKDNYEETKKDLFATFIVRCLELAKKDGLTGYMSPFVWMFISSYEDLRKNIIDNHTINNLIQLEYSGFDVATVPICTFTLSKKHIDNYEGGYIRLSDFKGSKNQAPKTLEAIQNPECNWYYTATPEDFKEIPGSPIGYWIGSGLLKLFNYKTIKDIASSNGQNITGNNNRFLRKFWEVEKQNTNKEKWVLCARGGGFRKWQGNVTETIDWSEKARKHYKNDKISRIVPV